MLLLQGVGASFNELGLIGANAFSMPGTSSCSTSSPQRIRFAGHSNTAHNGAATASTAPTPLNVVGLVMTTSTGYFHCMNLAHAVQQSVPRNRDDTPRYPEVRKLLIERQSLRSRGRHVRTPVCALPPKVFPYSRNNDHRKEQFQLL